MRVLHLFSNAKWTGPAEPALNLCVALRKRGVEADFACSPDAGGNINKVVETARDRGIEPILQFHLTKYLNPLTNWSDQRALPKFLKRNPYDLIHCHMDNDHRIALNTLGKHHLPIIRSNYKGEGLQGKPPYAKWLPNTARLLEPSQIALDYDAVTYHYPREHMHLVPGAVDTERFDPSRDVPDARRWLGIPPTAFVVGIVARMQTHRRYEDFFRAARMLVDARPDTHIIVVGRGTNQDKVGKEPVKDLGLGDHVHFPGFVDGENYVGMLKAFDAKVFLVPGSDGTCRAVREAMAMAKPAVVADRGMLREIVDDGETGFVFDGSVDGLYEALHRLSSDRALARRLGQAARQKALEVFSLDRQAEMVEQIYVSALSEH
ncbi:MAG: glycosyltransferase family 4 protein [Candidatus Hydrogenedentes bacterium]|nr:glycosyltransferase family 4 protein [Candidatus Hydrogenedentota bacterium]